MNSAVPPNTFCTGCGYSLAGLREDGKCPECGRLVADTLIHLEHMRGKTKPLFEIAEGLASIKVGYAVAAGAFLGVLAAWLISYTVRGVSLFLLAISMISLLAVAGTLFSGHIGLTTALHDDSGHKPKNLHGKLIGLGVAGMLLGPFVFLPLAIGTGFLPLIVTFFAVMVLSAVCTITGMSILAKKIERRTTPSNFLRAGRALASAAVIHVGVCGAMGVYFSKSSVLGSSSGVFIATLVATAVVYLAAHITLTFALASVIRRGMNTSPPPAPPPTLG